MAGSVRTKVYTELLQQLVELRTECALSQAALAKVLGKPPSFVGKYELGERRLDVIELLAILKALDADPNEVLGSITKDLPKKLAGS